MAGSTQPVAVTKGKRTKVFCALKNSGDREEPTAVTLTLTAGPAKGATTLAITSVTTKIYKGQYVLFEDSNDKVYLAQVDADYTTGVSLTVKPLAEAIPNAAVAAFPVPFLLRTACDINTDTGLDEVNTFDHDVTGDASPGATTVTIDIPGLYSYYNAGLSTARYAQVNSQELYVIRELDTPNAAAFTKGDVEKGCVILSSRSSSAPNEGSVSGDVSGRFVSYTLVDPVPVA